MWDYSISRPRRFFAIIPSFLQFLLGIPGYFDDGKTWMEWLSMIDANWQWWNYILIILGIVTFLYATVPQKVLSWIETFIGFGKVPQRVEGAEQSQTESPEQRQVEGSESPKVYTKPPEICTEQPPRVYTERTIREIYSRIKNLTNMEMARFTQPHIGKWIRVQNIVSNIYCEEKVFGVLLGREMTPIVYLEFSRKEWPSIETMTRGDRLAAEGKIRRIDQHAMFMDCCEIVEQSEKDDVFKQSETEPEPEATTTKRKAEEREQRLWRQWEADRGNGRLAARLMLEVDLGNAEEIYRDFMPFDDDPHHLDDATKCYRWAVSYAWACRLALAGEFDRVDNILEEAGFSAGYWDKSVRCQDSKADEQKFFVEPGGADAMARWRAGEK